MSPTIPQKLTFTVIAVERGIVTIRMKNPQTLQQGDFRSTGALCQEGTEAAGLKVGQAFELHRVVPDMSAAAQTAQQATPRSDDPNQG